MILDGTVELEDTVQNYLPTSEIIMPDSQGVAITLKHLAIHGSGIPKKPHNTGFPFPPDYDLENAYAAYTTEHIYDYLSNYCTLLFIPGTSYHYSNIGMGLLGHILGIVNGSNYEDQMAQHIFIPLGMNSTVLFVSEEQDTNLAMGYSTNFEERPDWDADDIFQGAGFIKSTLNDMMKYLKMNMGLLSSPLSDAILLTHQAHFNVGTVTHDDRPGEVFELTMGLGWHKHKNSDGLSYFWHGGRTNGHTAYIGFDESKSFGVVILCNYEGVPIITFGDEVLRAINKY
jgi:CubicO group peptidase (beta-lactamase class C family)